MRLIDADIELKQMLECDWSCDKLELRQKMLNINRSQPTVNIFKEILNLIDNEIPMECGISTLDRKSFNAFLRAKEIIKEVKEKYEID